MNPRTLFVDDEDSIRLTFSALLQSKGFEVTTAATVKDALALIVQHQFDILIADLNIGTPGDGFTVISAMRSTQPEALRLILTGYPDFESAVRAIQEQVHEYVIKPADIEDLLRKVSTFKRSRWITSRTFARGRRMSVTSRKRRATPRNGTARLMYRSEIAGHYTSETWFPEPLLTSKSLNLNRPKCGEHRLSTAAAM